MPSEPTGLVLPKYRPDIDGLRALAVLSVLGFHTAPDLLPGGFVGVDIFFVISGFLIGTILLENLMRGSFSFAEFYARRIRRIFPALIVVLVASHVLGWHALLADEYRELGKHIAAGAGFILNFVLWGESGYFDQEAATKPLLHLWSLGIEEQFYLAWPLLLWLGGRRVLVVMLLVALASFCINVVMAGQDPVGAFYSPQARFWELASGSLLAWFWLRRREAGANVGVGADGWLTRSGKAGIRANFLAWLAALLLAYGLFFIDRDVLFVGAWALIPVAGAALVILAGPGAWLNRHVLSSGVAVWFGLISYPLYLWHWPLLSLARVAEGGTPSLAIRLFAVALSILLAWLTYVLIERPIRHGGDERKRTVTALAVLMLAVCGVGLGTYLKDGVPRRFPETANNQEPTDAEKSVSQQAIANCERNFPDWRSITDNACWIQREGASSIAIIGDSHAGHLFLGFSQAMMPDDGVAVFSASCAAPFLDVATGLTDKKARGVRERAHTLIARAYDFILQDPAIKVVVLAHNPVCSYQDARDLTDPAVTDYREALARGLDRTLSRLVGAGKSVVILFDNPHVDFDPKMCALRPVVLTDHRCSFPRWAVDQNRAFSNYRAMVDRVVQGYPQVRTIDLADAFCDSSNCRVDRGGQVLYHDHEHLNRLGSRYVASYLLDAIRAAK